MSLFLQQIWMWLIQSDFRGSLIYFIIYDTEWSTAAVIHWEERPVDFCRWSYPDIILLRLLLFSSWKPPQYLLIPFIESADNPTLPLSLWSAHYGVGFRASQWETGRAGEGDSCNLSPFLFWQSCSSNTLANHRTTHFSRLHPVLYRPPLHNERVTGQLWVTEWQNGG